MGWNPIEDIKKAGGDVVEGAKKAASDVVEAGKNVAEASVAVTTAPIQVAVEVAQGKPIDKAAESAGQNIIDTGKDAAGTAVAAVAGARMAENQFTVDLARAVAGESGADAAHVLIADKEYTASIAAVLPALLEKEGPPPTPEEIATMPVSVLLAAALKTAADQLRPKSQAVPEMVQMLLNKVHTADVLHRAKYVVGKVGINLPMVINGVQNFMGNHSHAVTVDEVIVFSTEPGQTKADLKWWAHELAHVVQYSRLGILGFAEQYVADFKALEAEADSKANELGV